MSEKDQPFPKMFFQLVAINVILVALAIIFYSGSGSDINEYFSYIGKLKTAEGTQNIISMSIFSLEMIISGLILLLFSKRYHDKNHTPNSDIKSFCCLIAGIGFLMVGFFPDDIGHATHVMGIYLAVGFLWVLATNYLYESRKVIKPFLYYILQIPLQIAIFSYAFIYFLNMNPVSYVMQKIAIAWLCIVFLSTLFIKHKSCNP